MSKRKEKKEIITLDLEVLLLQMEKFSNNFNSAMKKEFKTAFKKIAIVMAPLLLSVVGYIIIGSPILLLIGTSITGISGTAMMSHDFIKDIRGLKSNNSNKQSSNIIAIEEEKDVNEVLKESLGNKKGEDFYTEKYKNVLKKEESYVETEEEKKYREALEKQKQKFQNNSNLKIVGSNMDDYLDKEDTMIQMVREIDAYRYAYKLPPIEISNSEWDLLFDKSYSLFVEKRIENKFYESMSEIGRFVFAKALLNKKSKVNIYDFVENLYYLERQKINHQEIKMLQQDILTNLPPAKIIDFSEYESQKKKKLSK